MLKKCLDELQNLENIAPNKMAPNARKKLKKLGQVCENMAAGLSGVDHGTGKLLRGSGLQYAAEKSVMYTMTLKARAVAARAAATELWAPGALRLPLSGTTTHAQSQR